jgi:shikimate kinase
LGYAFVDTDKLIEDDQHMAIISIFESRGEPYFREVEARIIKHVMQGERQVVSTGGGAVIRDVNRQAFKDAGLVVCLTARPEVIYARIKHETHRPLLQTPDPRTKIKELLDSRARFYAQADVIIDTSDRTVDEVITEIKERIKHAYC